MYEPFVAAVHGESRERSQSQIYNGFWLIIWHLGMPSMFSRAAALGQNLELVSIQREVKAGAYRVSTYLASRHLIHAARHWAAGSVGRLRERLWHNQLEPGRLR